MIKRSFKYMNLEIFKFGYKLTDFPNHKNITYVECDIHGITPCSYKRGVCDKCYRKIQYEKNKERNLKKIKYCLYHGLQEVNSSGKCKICESYKRQFNKIVN